jgi:hypothetical protein
VRTSVGRDQPLFTTNPCHDTPTGDRVPVFDISKYYLPNDTQDLLVKNQRLGAAFAREFSSAPSNFSSYPNSSLGFPAHNLLLMQSHGFTTCATDLKIVTYQGIYALTDAKVESEALQIQHAYTGRAARNGEDGNGLVYLTPKQVRDTWETMLGTISRPWGLWEREVRVNPLYVNELDDGD